jgi:hypothetical protein
MAQHLCSQRIIPKIVSKSQGEIRLNGVQTLVLKRIGFDLVEQPDSTPFLRQIKHGSTLRTPQQNKRCFQLISTVTPEGTEHITRKTFRVQPDRNTTLTSEVTPHAGNKFFAVRALESDKPKLSKSRRKLSLRDKTKLVCLGLFTLPCCCHPFHKLGPLYRFLTTNRREGTTADLPSDRILIRKETNVHRTAHPEKAKAALQSKGRLP